VDAGSFSIDSIDLTNVAGVELTIGGQKVPTYGYAFELRLDSPNGTKLGEATAAANAFRQMQPGFFGSMVRLNIAPVTDGKMHNVYIVSKPVNPQEKGTVIISGIEFRSK
jgi:hypothetical protein